MAAACVVVSHDLVFKQIQKAIPDCIAADEVEPIYGIVDGKISETVKVYVETAVRYYVVQNLCKGTDPDLSKITAVAKLSADLARKEACLPTLPILVLSDAFDSLTVPQCEQLFSFVESNVALWKEPMFFTPCKNQVLRMCNDVLRRLSRSQNTSFCGRILLFLARFFPFSERSGLNLISEFNLENVTNFAATAEEEAMDTDEIETVNIDDDAPKEADPHKDSKPSQDNSLHTKFWALQDFFRNPSQCYSATNMNKFSQYSADVLAAFSSFKLDADTHIAKKSPGSYDVTEYEDDMDKTILDTMPDANKSDQYFAKFLTNKRLLDLQFSDSNFRRYFLVQILILCHYLTSKTRFKLPREKLSKPQEEFVRSLEVKVFSLLRETPPDGDAFVAVIIKLLKREDLWSAWKDEGCKEIEKPTPVVDMDTEMKDEAKPKKKRLGDEIREASSRRKFVMANPEMTRLWNLCPDNVAATRQERRDFTPSLETYFKKSVGQVTGDTPIENSLVSDENFGWRGLRILACRSPHFFTHSTSPIATLPEYLTSMVRKLAKDMPQHVVSKPTPETAAKEEAKEEESKEDEDVKMISDTTDQTEYTEEDQAARAELKPLTEEQQTALATKLATLGKEKWMGLTKKMGFTDDEVDYIMTEKKNNGKECLVHFLKLWVENEGEEANVEQILYVLGGLKLQQHVEGVL